MLSYNNESNVYFYEDEYEKEILDCEKQKPPQNISYKMCPALHDGLMCWNYTRAGEIVKQHCPAIPDFNTSAFAYKQCLSSGDWMQNSGNTNKTYTNYMDCVPRTTYTIYIYFVGYSISVLALTISLAVLIYFKQLSCDRTTLHKNLFLCNLINSTGWIAYFTVLVKHSPHPVMKVMCRILYIVVNYTGTATYFWMLSEGLYLVLILVFAFNKGPAIMRYCIIQGWGFPMVITGIFVLLWFANATEKECQPLQFKLMYIMLVPIFITITLNIIFMVFILVILFKKLRNETNVEQHRGLKAAKAILILTPVMGLHSLLLMVQPDNYPWREIHMYVSAVSNSLQGLVISMPFCFFNNEVHNAIRTRRRRWEGIPKNRLTARPTSSNTSRPRRRPTNKFNNSASE